MTPYEATLVTGFLHAWKALHQIQNPDSVVDVWNTNPMINPKGGFFVAAGPSKEEITYSVDVWKEEDKFFFKHGNTEPVSGDIAFLMTHIRDRLRIKVDQVITQIHCRALELS